MGVQASESNEMTWPGVSNLDLVSNLLDFETYQADMGLCTVFEHRDVRRRDFGFLDNNALTPTQRDEYRQSLFWGDRPPPPPNPDWSEALRPYVETAVADLAEQFDVEFACEVLIVIRSLPSSPLHSLWEKQLEQLAERASPGFGLAARVRQQLGA